MRGFSLPELISILVISTILVAVLAPRFTGSGINEGRLANEATAALRYAQSAALAMQRTVCVSFTSTTVTFNYVGTYGVTNCADPSATGLTPPGGGTGPYQIVAQSPAAFTVFPASFSFDRAGRPSAAQSITLSNGTLITVEAESGYVH